MPNRSLPSGRRPSDFANGIRVGGVAGGLIGGGLLVLLGWEWFLPIGVIVGAVAGTVWQRHELRIARRTDS